MTEKQCVSCGKLNEPDSNYCSNCGSRDFRDVRPGLATRLAEGTGPMRSSAVRINTGRVIIASVLSLGFYLFYWLYLTWKQLAAETDDTHYPVWHALCLVVPVYNLFRMHAHARVIRELATRQGITSTMAPELAVVLLIVENVLGFSSSIQVPDYGMVIVVAIISTLLTTTLIVLAQEGLNRYWNRVWPDGLSDARVGAGEVVFVVLGLIFWILILIPQSALE